MPIYEYHCTACGHELEAMQKISEQPLTECPDCGKSSLQKLISAAGFQLKGTGWYATDFRNKGKPESKDKTSSPVEKTSTDTSTSDAGSKKE